MKKILVPIMWLLLGTVVGMLGTVGTYYLNHQSTEIWTSKVTLQDDKGLIIPAGTQFSHLRWMPEGFATLRLYLNVEGSTLDTFAIKHEPKFNLVIPYSVWEK